MRVACVSLIAFAAFAPAGAASAGEALPAPVVGAHYKSGGIGLGETVTVGKAIHTVVGVREIWSRGTAMTYSSAEGLKLVDPKIPIAYLYKVEDGRYVFFPTTGRDAQLLPDDSADSIFQFGHTITGGRNREADVKACFSGNLATPVSSPAPTASP